MVNFFHFDQENVYLAARTLILFGTKFEEILTSYSFSHAACPIFVQHGFWSKIGQIFGQERLDLMVNQLNQERSPCWALRKPLQDNLCAFEFIFFLSEVSNKVLRGRSRILQYGFS